MHVIARVMIMAFLVSGLTISLLDRGSAQAHESSGVKIPAVPEEGGPRNWEVVSRLNVREQPGVRAKILSQYEVGTILDNLGCQHIAGMIWCDVQRLGGGMRGYVAADYLKPAVSPDGSVAIGPDDSAERAGQGDFDATGQIRCSQWKNQTRQWCDFGVARAGGGYATVVISKPDGSSRAIFFRMNKAIGSDTSQADGYHEFSAMRESDNHIIIIRDERYEIPDVVTLGD